MRTLISILSLLLLTCGLTSAVNLTAVDLTDVASWLKPLVITTVGDGKINVPSEYAIVRATIESELPVKERKKEGIVIGSGELVGIVIGSGVGSEPAAAAAILPAQVPGAGAAAAATADATSPSASDANATTIDVLARPPDYTDIIKKVQQDVADKTQSVLDYLKKQGKDVWQIETQQVSVYPIYDYIENPPSIVAYHASISLSFRVIVSRAGTVLDGITAAGVSRIDGVSYGVSDDKIAQAEKSAIVEAVKNALERAQAAQDASKTGSKTKQTLTPIDINIQAVGTGPNYPIYPPIAYDKAVSARATTTPILAEETIVTASVIAKFEAK